jgi:hypothetical protein
VDGFVEPPDVDGVVINVSNSIDSTTNQMATEKLAIALPFIT